MVDIKLWPHQDKCIESKKNLPKSLINIWCGGGKTRIIVYSIFDDDQEINVIVFPSLGLINQFNNDYILSDDFMDYFKEYTCLSVCSDSESKLKIKTDIISYTTKESKIKSTLKKTGKKLFTVTYQSLELFVNILVETNTIVNRLYYDEAHHILGSIIQKIVFENETFNELTEKTEYYTATPENRNGITMYDREHPENSDCGPIAYEYLFYQAVKDMISKDFTMKLMLYPKTEDDKYINLFESIFRECFSGEYDYWNILTFHSMVEEKDELATVNELSKKLPLFKKAFLKVIEEFPEKKELYSVDKVFLKGVGSKTKGREKIIEGFDKPEIGRIYLLASCKTLGEGIDTKYANMEIPINPGGSLVYEQQKLGRITRNPDGNNPNGIVLIPCWIDMEQYDGLNREERDEMIRQELHEGGNFNTFLNVMSAYKNQCDPELWELCLKYPKMYSPKEIKDNLDKQGFKVGESKGDLIDNVNHIVDENISELVGETDEETIQNIVSTGKQVEIHSQDKDLPIITYGSETDEEPIRLFKDEEDVYHPVSKKEPSEKRRKIEKPDKLKRKKLVNIHMNDEIKVLWKIDMDSFDVNNAFCHGVLDAEIDYNEKKWFENLEKLKKYIDEHKRLPSSHDKNINIKAIGSWLDNQKTNYRKNIKNMVVLKIKIRWEEFNQEYSEYFKDNKEVWIEKLNELKIYIKIHKKLPSSHDKNTIIKALAQWLHTQSQNYKNNCWIMTVIEINKTWEKFTDEYNEYFKTNEEKWYDKLNELEEYITINKKLPPSTSKKHEKMLCTWKGTQNKNYIKKIEIMGDEKIRKSWKEFTDKYSEYFKTFEEIWYEHLDELKEYIIQNNEIPKQSGIDKTLLGSWYSNQKTNYRKNIKSMLNEKIRIDWEKFIEEYSEYTGNNKWYITLDMVKKYIDYNKKLPSCTSKKNEIKSLGIWISSYKQMKKNNKMKDEYIKPWENFIKEYSEYFITDEVKWYENLNKLEEYIIENNELPSQVSNINNTKLLGRWIVQQKLLYKNGSMKKSINDNFLKFIEKYKSLFTTNEELWFGKLEKLKSYIDENKISPSSGSKHTETKQLGTWMNRQKIAYNIKSMVQEYIQSWEDFTKDYSEYFKTNDEVWFEKLEKLKSYIDENKISPSSGSKHTETKQLGAWMDKQKSKYNTEVMQSEYLEQWVDFIKNYSEYFTTTKTKKDMSKKEVNPKSKKETTEQKQQRVQPILSQLHQKYKTMNSQTLHKHFEDNPDDWINYHKISESNEETFPDEEIPYKKIIQYLEHIPGKKKKDVADLGCGKARVCEYFSESERFKFINMDHVSCNDLVVKQDIKNTGLEDYSMDVVVLSLAMWGSNCKEYITEANRILDENGVLLIIEATKRWTDDETGENKLVKLLEEKGFTIKNMIEEKFMFIECIKQ